jgi:hypothetical protein
VNGPCSSEIRQRPNFGHEIEGRARTSQECQKAKDEMKLLFIAQAVLSQQWQIGLLTMVTLVFAETAFRVVSLPLEQTCRLLAGGDPSSLCCVQSRVPLGFFQLFRMRSKRVICKGRAGSHFESRMGCFRTGRLLLRRFR